MSLDYPLYEEMLRRKSRAAPWWRIGDILYYLGLLVSVVAILAGVWPAPPRPASVVRWWSLSVFISGVAIFFVGARLKSYSYKLAGRDGIDPSRY